jgi:NAD(P)H-flavin reductase
LLFNNEFEVRPSVPKSQVLYFVIKVYEDGKLTPLLRDLPLRVEESLTIGSVRGNFNTDFLMGGDIYFLFGAGSGVTPHIRIIKYFLEHNVALGVSHVILAHWSKLEEDLLWKDSFENLSRDVTWFEYVPILTQCDEESKWGGVRGRICEDVFMDILGATQISKSQKLRVRFITCGTDGFNCTVCE